VKARAFVVIALWAFPLGAAASPKTKAAKAEFDKGVAAYQKQDYAAASAALGKSYGLEADTETLFAWAQSERQIGNCDKALELYEKLLKRDLPSANADAVRAKRDECSAMIASQKRPDPEPVKNEKGEPDTTKKADRVAEARPEIPERPAPRGGRAWWKDPIGGTLVAGGVGGIAAGTVFLMQGKKAQEDAVPFNGVDRIKYAELDERAKSRSKLGVIVGAAGGALLIGGVVRYVLAGGAKRRPPYNDPGGVGRTTRPRVVPRSAGGGENHTQVSAYFDGSNGGLVAFGRF
jgi:tetratricopeptide (TPR) repeat protein